MLEQKLSYDDAIELYRSTLERAVQRKINPRLTVEYFKHVKYNNYAFNFILDGKEVGYVLIYATNMQTTRDTGKAVFSYNHFHLYSTDMQNQLKNQAI